MSVADRVNRFCRLYGEGELDHLAGDAAEARDHVLQFIRDGGTGGAEELATALDVLERDAARRGGARLTAPNRGGVPRVPGGSGYPVASAWKCPHGACSRLVVQYSAGDGDEPDPCAVSGRELVRVGLSR